MATEAAARIFFSAKYFAVVGASSDPSKFGHKIFNWYTQNSISAIPINPSAPSITAPAPPTGTSSRPLQQIYSTLPNLSALPHPAETSVSIITPPNVTRKVLEEAQKVGVHAVWLQPGSFDEEGLEWALKAFEGRAVGGHGGAGVEGWCVLVDGGRAREGRGAVEGRL